MPVSTTPRPAIQTSVSCAVGSAGLPANRSAKMNSAGSTALPPKMPDIASWVSPCRRARAAAAKIRISGIAPSEPIVPYYRKHRKNNAPKGGIGVGPRLILERNGQRHREAHPAAVPDLVPDGGATADHRARDQAGGRGLLGHERRGVRPSFLR